MKKLSQPQLSQPSPYLPLLAQTLRRQTTPTEYRIPPIPIRRAWANTAVAANTAAVTTEGNRRRDD